MSEYEKKPHLGLIVFCLVMFTASLAVEFFTVRSFLRAYQIASWPIVQGVVQRSELGTEFVGAMRYTAHIVYDYNVDGIPYSSSSIRERGASNKHRWDVEAVVDKFPAGSEVTVYYNEADHSQSYLEAGLDFVYYIIIISPLVFAFMFGTGFYELYKKRRRLNNSDESSAEST